MNITYLFGAGSSVKACPILKGLGEKMVDLSKKFLDAELHTCIPIKQYTLKPRSTNDPNVFEEENILDRINGIKNVISILKKLEFVVDNQNIGWLSFGRHINYAWEKNPLAEKARLAAREIFKNTDILVIIGYSFPPFNKEIDQELFNELKNKKTKIFYQDPNASEEFISILTKNFDTEVKCIKDKLDHFYLPYDY